MIEGHTRDEQELRKSFKDQLKQAEDEVVNYDCTIQTQTDITICYLLF